MKNIVFFDWDDTLLASTWLQAETNKLIDSKQELCQLQIPVIKFLETILSYPNTKICIVTNSEKGWVKLSGDLYVPKLMKFLEDNNIPIVSARSTYEKWWPNNVIQWKMLAMKKFIVDLNLCGTVEEPLNILAIGDAMSDRQAIIMATCGVENCHVKKIKLVEGMNLHQLFCVWEVMNQALPHYIDRREDLDLQITITFNDKKLLHIC